MSDPSVSPDVYLELASRHGWSIRYVLETHVHADHLSRARELVRQTDATLLMPTQQRVRFVFRAIADGERIPLGGATLAAIRTPGHTGESTSYVLNETAVFTGDTLFTNGVGRPDLHADPEAARQRARALFALNAAGGDAKVNAVAAVVAELVRQHKSMHERMGHMHGQMMGGRGMMMKK